MGCGVRIYDGLLEMEESECIDLCEAQTVDCEPVAKPLNIIGSGIGLGGSSYADCPNLPGAKKETMQVSAFWVYAVFALLIVLATVNVTCLVIQRRSNGKNSFEPVNYDSS